MLIDVLPFDNTEKIKEDGEGGGGAGEGGRVRDVSAQALLDVVSITIHKVSLCTLTALASNGSSTNTRVTSSNHDTLRVHARAPAGAAAR